VLGVWPLHGLCGTWGGIGCGILGQPALGGLGGVNLGAQVAGTALGIVVAVAGAAIVCGVLRQFVGLRLSDEEEFDGADVAIHRISATPEREVQY
jgi:Amt family ammonium transporter